MARRRRRSAHRRRRNSWSDNTSGHSKAARLGWSRKGRRRRRKNPFTSRTARLASRKRWARRRNPRALSYLPNPYGRRRRRYSRRWNARRRFALGRIVPSQAMLRQAVKVGTGVAAGFVSTPVISMLLSKMGLSQYDNFAGVGQILLGSLMVGMVRNRNVKEVGLMITGFGVYDLVASNLKRADGSYWLPPLQRSVGIMSMIPGMSASYGVAVAPVSPVSRAGIAASYSPQVVGASFEAPALSTVGLAGDVTTGIDWE
jgi:hypothetical protein